METIGKDRLRRLYGLDKAAGALEQDLTTGGTLLAYNLIPGVMPANVLANAAGAVYGVARHPDSGTPTLNSRKPVGSFLPGIGAAQAVRRRVMMHRHYGSDSPRHRAVADALGPVLRALLYGAAGAGAGAVTGSVTGAGTGGLALLGGLTGAGTSLGIDLLSGLTGLITDTPTDTEQREHEARGVGAYDWLVPGSYDSARSLRKLYSDSYRGRDTYLGGGKDGDDSGNDDKRDKED